MAKSKAAERRESKVVTKCDNPTEIAQNHEEMVTYVTQSSPKLKSKGGTRKPPYFSWRQHEVYQVLGLYRSA